MPWTRGAMEGVGLALKQGLRQAQVGEAIHARHEGRP